MPKDEWGVKRVCPSCEGRFYDLQKEDMVCPYCEAEFSLTTLLSDKPQVEKADAKEKDSKDESISDADDVLDDDGDDDIVVDDALLDDDDDDEVSLEEIADVPAEDED